MKKMLPALLIGLALLGSLAGPYTFWRTADRLLTQRAARREQARVDRQQKEKGWDFWTLAIDNLTSELKEEKARLRQQAEQLDQRTARLAAERQELDKLRLDLEATRHEIDERVIAIGADESRNLRTLSQTYTNLTPHAAVAIIREMDDTTVVKILSLMKPDVVGAIFEEMASGTDTSLAKRAANLSEKIRLMKSGRAVTAN
jgi:flagellar motility protein MotE (MotC chaperone)